MIVYKITNQINDKVYIGQTIRSLSERWSQHLRDSEKLDYPLYRAMSKYGKENFNIKAIYKTNNIEDLNKKEGELISTFKSTNRDFGYNVLSGGNNWKMPQEMKDKISKALTGKKFKSNISKEEKSSIAKKNGAKAYSTKEKKEKWAVKNGSKSFKVYKAICKQFRKRNQPSIYEKGEYIGEWLMTTECAKNLGIDSRHIRDCLAGKRKQHKGFMFERIKGD